MGSWSFRNAAILSRHRSVDKVHCTTQHYPTTVQNVDFLDGAWPTNEGVDSVCTWPICTCCRGCWQWRTFPTLCRLCRGSCSLGLEIRCHVLQEFLLNKRTGHLGRYPISPNFEDGCSRRALCWWFCPFRRRGLDRCGHQGVFVQHGKVTLILAGRESIRDVLVQWRWLHTLLRHGSNTSRVHGIDEGQP